MRNELKSGVILSYVSLFLGNVMSIIYVPVMLRLLGQSEYGLYQLVASVVSYLGLLSFGFGGAYIRYYSIYKANNDIEKIYKLNGMYLMVFSVIAFIAIVAGGFLVLNVETIFREKLIVSEIEKAKILMAILTVNMAISFPASVFTSFITAHEKYTFQRTVNLVKIVMNPIVVLSALFLGFRSIGMVLATTLLNICIELLNLSFAKKKLKIRFSFRHFDLAVLKDIAIFSSFIFLNLVTDQINWNADKFILGMLQGTAAVAVYSIAGQLNNYYMQFSTAISTVFIPRVNRLVAEKESKHELTELFTKVGRVQFLILLLILSGAVVLGKPFILAWAGPDYGDAYYIMLVLIIPVTVPLIQNLGIEIQRAMNMHRFRSVLYIGMAMINIIISIPLGKLYGGIGCAIGTASSLIIGNGIVMNFYYSKKIGLDIAYFWKEIFKLARGFLIPAMCGTVILKYIHIGSIGTFMISGFIYVLVYSISMWLFGLNYYEKQLILGLIRRIGERMGR